MQKVKTQEPLEIMGITLYWILASPDEIVEASNDMRVLFAVTKRMVLVLNRHMSWHF